MIKRPANIIFIKLGSPATIGLCARVDATTRNARGQETSWMLMIGKDGLRGACKCGERSAFPYTVGIDQVPGNLSDLAVTIAAA